MAGHAAPLRQLRLARRRALVKGRRTRLYRCPTMKHGLAVRGRGAVVGVVWCSIRHHDCWRAWSWWDRAQRAREARPPLGACCSTDLRRGDAGVAIIRLIRSDEHESVLSVEGAEPAAPVPGRLRRCVVVEVVVFSAEAGPTCTKRFQKKSAHAVVKRCACSRVW